MASKKDSNVITDAIDASTLDRVEDDPQYHHSEENCILEECPKQIDPLMNQGIVLRSFSASLAEIANVGIYL